MLIVEFSPELTALSPTLFAKIFKISTCDSEKSKASFKIFINLTFLISPSEKSISTASELILKKLLWLIKKLDFTILITSSDEILEYVILCNSTLVSKKLIEPKILYSLRLFL